MESDRFYEGRHLEANRRRSTRSVPSPARFHRNYLLRRDRGRDLEPPRIARTESAEDRYDGSGSIEALIEPLQRAISLSLPKARI